MGIRPMFLFPYVGYLNINTGVILLLISGKGSCITWHNCLKVLLTPESFGSISLQVSLNIFLLAAAKGVGFIIADNTIVIKD